VDRTKESSAVGSLNPSKPASPQYHATVAGQLEVDRTDSPHVTESLGLMDEELRGSFSLTSPRQDNPETEPLEWAMTDLTHNVDQSQVNITEVVWTTETLGAIASPGNARMSPTRTLLPQLIHCTIDDDHPRVLPIGGLQLSKKLVVYSRKKDQQKRQF
jgi:hypothetical protein